MARPSVPGAESAPTEDKWYPLVLGDSFRPNAPVQYYTLRCAFAHALITGIGDAIRTVYLVGGIRVSETIVEVKKEGSGSSPTLSAKPTSSSRPPPVPLAHLPFLSPPSHEFKPASIDSARPGTLRRGGESRGESKVGVELPNNQPGKPPVEFEGHVDPCRDQEGLVLFDGRSFRLERLHYAVRNLRHIRLAKEKPAGTAGTVGADAGGAGGVAGGGAGGAGGGDKGGAAGAGFGSGGGGGGGGGWNLNLDEGKGFGGAGVGHGSREGDVGASPGGAGRGETGGAGQAGKKSRGNTLVSFALCFQWRPSCSVSQRYLCTRVSRGASLSPTFPHFSL
ncbi:unnamed protein product [Closterium sp. Yama58-4]|nr:unnamed protein product [Closterium sp. Yama58-4]